MDEIFGTHSRNRAPRGPTGRDPGVSGARRGSADRVQAPATEDTAESKLTVFKTVAAYANGYGGNIVFGVEKDEATVCGLNGIDP
jgi:Putative DNA-binding domain